MFPFIASNISRQTSLIKCNAFHNSYFARKSMPNTGYDYEWPLPDVSDLETIFIPKNSMCPTKAFRTIISEK